VGALVPYKNIKGTEVPGVYHNGDVLGEKDNGKSQEERFMTKKKQGLHCRGGGGKNRSMKHTSGGEGITE